MRTFLLTAGLSLFSVTWLAAQEATPGNSSRPEQVDQAGGRAGQNPGRQVIDQTPATPGQNRRQSAGQAGQTQTQTQTRTQIQGQTQGQTRVGHEAAASSGQLDSLIINCVRGSNRNEIELSKLAAQKATNPEVKAFAQQMVKDHSDFLAKLDRLNRTVPVSRQTGATSETRESTSTSPGTQTDTQNRREVNSDRDPTDSATSGTRASSDGDARSKTSDARREDNRPAGNPSAASEAQEATRTNRARANQRTTTGQAGVSGPAGVSGQAEIRTGTTTAVQHNTVAHGGNIVGQLIQIEQEIADRCLASAQRELNQKQGKDFDMAYVGMQIVAHMGMVDKLSVFSRHASGELQQVLNEGLETSQQHLEHVKQLVHQVESSADSNPNAAANPNADSENRNATPGAAPRKNRKANDR
jgi:predicted outer membrane protein